MAQALRLRSASAQGLLHETCLLAGLERSTPTALTRCPPRAAVRAAIVKPADRYSQVALLGPRPGRPESTTRSSGAFRCQPRPPRRYVASHALRPHDQAEHSCYGLRV